MKEIGLEGTFSKCDMYPVTCKHSYRAETSQQKKNNLQFYTHVCILEELEMETYGANSLQGKEY